MAVDLLALPLLPQSLPGGPLARAGPAGPLNKPLKPAAGCATMSGRRTATTTSAGESLGIVSAPNLRDVGGYRTAGGARVRRGLLYRSTALHRLEGADAAAFARLGIRSVYDLRGADERSAEPDRLPPGTEYVVADGVAGLNGEGPGKMFAWFQDPPAAREGLGNGRAEAIWTGQYRQFVTLPSALGAYGRLFRDVASSSHRPALFHCSTGKDRTGWAAAILLLLLGVPYETVLGDYLRSEVYLEPLVRPFIDDFEARGGDPELLRPIFGVTPAYLDAGLEEVRRRFGSIERYFEAGLGVDEAARTALCEAFLESA